MHTYVSSPVDVDSVKLSIGQNEASNRPRRGNVLSRDIAGVVDSERDRGTGSRVINLRELPVTKQESVSPARIAKCSNDVTPSVHGACRCLARVDDI